jgi:hypothetical protein
MPTIQDVVWQHGDAYLHAYGDTVLPSHRRALRAIAMCKTGALGGHQYQCQSCGYLHQVMHACRHRMCPGCQHQTAEAWLEKQAAQLLDVPYFHLVFTLPDVLRPIVASHQREMINTLFYAARQSLSDLCADARYLGGDIGMLMVLHTWSRTLLFHPHLHVLVPGVAITPDGDAVVAKPNFLVPVYALSDRFRNLFLKRAQRRLPNVTFPEALTTTRFVTYSKSVPKHPGAVLSYFARYVNKTAISNHRLLAVTDTTVTFRYTDLKDTKRKTMTLPAHEFLRRLLCHTPMRGLHRIRHAGLLHPKKRPLLAKLQYTFGPKRGNNLAAEPDATETTNADHIPAEREDSGALQRSACPMCGHAQWIRLHDLQPRPPPTLNGCAQLKMKGLQ